ncbi:MAG: spoIIIJ-associated protein [Thermotogaceae bacterium]|jgi:spoIIIJ-associated protein|nr:spoIIIJ-associated protein [Thermotogaceae bacterium]
MKTFYCEGKSVEDALEKVFKDYDIKEEEYSYEVVEKGFRGIFGIGFKPIKLQITLKKSYFERKVREFIENILSYYNGEINYEVIVKSNQRGFVIIIDSENVGRLIGKHGKALGALQHIVNLYLNRLSDKKLNVVIEVGDYKRKRREQLKDIAYEAVNNVLRTKKKVVLDPMFAFERRIIHELVKSYPKLRSYSVGLEPYRRVVIEYKNGNSLEN